MEGPCLELLEVCVGRLYDLRRHADGDRVAGDVARYDRSRTDNNVAPDGDPP